MTRVHADIEAIKGLRLALLSFANHEVDILGAIESEIALTQSMLEDAERHWRYEVNQRQAYLEDCLREAAYAARQGGHVDCSPCKFALMEAQEHLARIVRWQTEVESAVAQYRPEIQRFADLLRNHIPRAAGFLADRVTALEAYHSMRSGTTPAVSGLGVLAVIGGVISAVRHSKETFGHAMGSAGEQVAAHVLSEKFGLQEMAFDQSHGFDRIFQAPGVPLIIVEVGPTAQQDPVNEQIARLVQDLWRENSPIVAIVTSPVSSLADIYMRQGDSSWQIVTRGVPFDRVPTNLTSGTGLSGSNRSGEELKP
jgi:hypothetical protein